ncbi:MAG: DNA gyrase inhibitor YacG [Myxococcota bacterium]|nr:DNA gyrase inhibitor YacG [Myxococcota bacterium]
MPACPVCKSEAPPEGDHAPFCSRRCKLIDLGQWLDEGYRIPDDAPGVPAPTPRTNGRQP